MLSFIAAIKTVWAATSGWKTYISALGLLLLGFYQIRHGVYEPAIQSILTGFVAIGLRDALGSK